MDGHLVKQQITFTLSEARPISVLKTISEMLPLMQRILQSNLHEPHSNADGVSPLPLTTTDAAGNGSTTTPCT